MPYTNQENFVMLEKDLPFDRTKHVIYTKAAKECVQRLLRRSYDEPTADELWEKVQLQYCEFLKEEPALKDLKITTSIYDPILIFAWYKTAEKKPPRELIQREIYACFFGAFDTNSYTSCSFIIPASIAEKISSRTIISYFCVRTFVTASSNIFLNVIVA